MIYGPQDLPEYRKTIATFKRIALEKGITEPYVVGSNSHTHALEGFDNIIGVEPKLSLLPSAFVDGHSLKKIARN